MKKNHKLLVIGIGGGCIVLAILAGFLLLSKASTLVPMGTVAQTGASPAIAGKYTLEELATHNTKSDCYIAYQQDVFNIGWFVSKHEGGEVIVEQCGKVVDEFSNNHPGGPFTKSAAQLVLKASKVGELVQE